ncbi:MAG: hypothetical protein Q8933_15005 [Bacteroidota bacterium]|nr:hypothetical protein [Bacteroidota bacterium]MDP4195433.1 hypothetical protein [Bacteroidota bacterium]
MSLRNIIRINKINLLLSVLLFPVAALFAAGKDSSEVKNFLNIDDTKYSTIIIANVGDMKITAQEFLTSYEFGPAFVKRENNSLRKYLDFMIYEKLLAKEGYSLGLDKSEDLKLILSDIEGDLATEQLYRKTIWDKIKLSNTEIEKGVKKEQVSVSLKWIFRPTLVEIEKDYMAIKNGVPFDSIFNSQLSSSDSIRYEDRSMEITRFDLERKNPLLSGIVDTLKAGQISLPIKTQDGCYIVKLDNESRNMIITESDLEKTKHDVEKVLFKERADSLSNQYVNSLLLSTAPVIIRLTFNILKANIAKKILPEDQFVKWDMLKNIRPDYPDFDPENITPYLKNKLVELKSGYITLEDFLKWYKTREPYIRFNTKSHQALYESLQQTVWRMLRDKLLTETAYKMKFEKLDEVRLQKKWWQDKLVYSQMKLNIASSIKIDENSLKDYYEKNKIRYKNDKGEFRSFEDARTDVKNDLYSYEYTKKVVNKVLGLKERVKININEKALNSLPVDIKEDPTAIEVYTVKQGGTFMRQAFPTIDFEWQYWN